ncbi:MAG: phosphopyruvate hydratase [Clostridia bacterium]|nr:phosphopyruvate hydratase [Clostridia bacterium]
MKIQKVYAAELLDSRGVPTVGATVVLSDGSIGVANAPSGASTGKYEAHEKRDGDKRRYMGRGVRKAVQGVAETIAPVLEHLPRVTVGEVDRILLELDGTPNKEKLGANAMLAVSLATAKALAMHYKQPLFRYVGGANAVKMPIPMMNILNGGAHAANNIDIQEFMILPVGAESFSEAIRMGAEVYHALGKLLRQRGLATAVGDEGGFAPDLVNDEAAIEVILDAITAAGYSPAAVKIALDAASSEWTQPDGCYVLPKRGTRYTPAQLVNRWEKLCEAYPICSIEDPLGEEDFPAWTTLTERIGRNVMLVGDDLFVTNPQRIREGILRKAANAVLVKPNQIGTLTETLDAVRLAKENGMRTILSHRSGETEDTTIADLAVAVNAGYIKTGAPCRSDRTAKYNRLLRIAMENGLDQNYGID